MRIAVLANETILAQQAASEIAAAATRAVEERGRFAVAFSGGSTPAAMLAALAEHDLAWERIEVFQVDERIAPDGPDRNLELLRRQLLDHAPIPAANVHPMPVGDHDPDAAARRYADELRRVCGDPPVVDLVHLGLGTDGHTASLLPGDPALDVTDTDVAVTEAYQGHRRLTLTVPALERAWRLLWLVAGADKAPAVRRLVGGDVDIPAGRIARHDASLLLDTQAAAELHRDHGQDR